MRSELPASVQALVAELTPADGPQLVYDLERLEAAMAQAAAAAREADVRVLFAVKSFPVPQVLALAAEHLHGFDIASPGELTAVAELLAPRHVVSAADPTGHTIAALAARWPAGPGGAGAGGWLVSCEDRTALTRALALPGAELSVRLSASLGGADPAVGSVQSGQGHHRSRFGVDAGAPLDDDPLVWPTRELAALASAAGERGLGLHVHQSEVAGTSSARWLERAQRALALADAAGVAPRFLDLGGGWHAAADLATTWRELRAALPSGLPLVVEPGRWFAQHAGFAVGWVRAGRQLADRELRVVDLSRVCHLRWSQLELVGAAPRPGHARKVLLAGPTCYEDDVLGEWMIDDARALDIGDLVVLRGVTGYAAAWNTGFGGLAPAAVRLVGGRRRSLVG